MDVKQITLSGSPYEKGLAHGKCCKAEVLRSLETYSHRYSVQRGVSWEKARFLARRFEGALKGGFEDCAEEMRGIADGAGLDYLDVLALNLRSEILYSGLKDMNFEPDECTAFSVLPPATRDGHVLAGQSWDFTVAQREASFIARVPGCGKTPAILMFLEGGMVGGKGVNSAGLCLTLNALTTKTAGIGVPLHLRMRRALEQRYLADAYKVCVLAPIPVPVNLMLTHKDALSFSIELDPAGAEILEGEGGILVHTNHYVGLKQMLAHPNSANGSTYIRRQRMLWLMKNKEQIALKDLEEFLRDHAGYPTSICAHPHPDTPQSELPYAGSTNYAFVADLTAGRIRFVMGNPCEGEFEDIEL